MTPSKLELLQAWLPGEDWFDEFAAGAGIDASSLSLAGAYRFDDPAGEVGVESFLLRAGEHTVHVPLTYRAAPLEGVTAAGTMQHSVLGERWVYPGWLDPVYAETLRFTISSAGKQAELMIQSDGQLTRREPDTFVRGSGAADGGQNVTDGPNAGVSASRTTSTDDGVNVVIRDGGTELLVLRVVGSVPDVASRGTLIGTWPGQSTPAVLAVLRP